MTLSVSETSHCVLSALGSIRYLFTKLLLYAYNYIFLQINMTILPNW